VRSTSNLHCKISFLPPLIMFLLAQKYFIEGIANTGLK
jgi:ABC-type glycerol-3-phosphate transport system permease component